MLKEKTGTRNIKGLSLSRTINEDRKLPGSLLELETDAFSKMNNLKMPEIYYVRHTSLPKYLVFLPLYVNEFPLQSMPSELLMKMLVALDMSYSNMESFDMSSSNMQQSGKRRKVTETVAKYNSLLGSLKILDLSHSYQLHTLGGFCEFPALETLILKNCTSLVEVCETMEQCHELVYIDLSYSNKCRKLLKNIAILKNVKSLILDGCNISDLPFETLKTVDANMTDLKYSASSFVTVEAIPRDSTYSLKEIHTDVFEQSSSSDNHYEKYDVFLSFRGADTRLSFTNHLHKSLEGANLKTFLDNEDIPSGLYLKPELENAIKLSAASVIVLSKNYATSTWCLEELVLILDRHKNFKQIVIPIFYHVEPTDVGKQQNSFRDAMEEHKQKMEAETDVERKRLLAEKIGIWKEALRQVSKLTGMDVKGRLETEFIEEIVNNVYHRIRVPIRSTLPLLIGMDNHVNFITSWLKDGSSHTVDILAIYGMGGIGKSSLAKYVYGSHCREFDRSSIILNISRRCVEQTNGLLELQKQLLGDISKTRLIQVHDVSIATSTIENALASNKVFIVLDDIDSVEQLNGILGNKGIHQGSKIIITTRDMSLTKRCSLFKTKVEFRYTMYLLKGLFDNTSLKLLCHHAFNCEEVKAGYEEFSDYIVRYCEGLPLALAVLGSYLYNRDVSYWEDCIKELKEGAEGPSSPINKILRISFVSLSSNDKELLKIIACFFVGKHRYSVETILKACKVNTRSGITNLIDRCLLGIGWSNELMMHSLIQVIGRDPVRSESDKPEERRLLWCHKESYKVLKKKKGTGIINGLALDMKMIENEKLRGSLFELETDALTKMDNLKLLQLNYVQLNGSYKDFPQKLRWLCMQWFPLETMPLDLPMKKLVALDLSYSNIKYFDMSCSYPQLPGKRQKVIESCSKENRLLGSLKILDLSHCYQLHTLGGFSEFPALESLCLINCTSLVEVCETIEQCHELAFIDVGHCNKCRKLLTNINILKNVKEIILDGCNICEFPFGTSKMVNANMIDLTLQLSSSATVEAIPRGLKSFGISLSSSLVMLSLAYSNLSNKSFPIDWSCLFMLKILILNGNPIVSIPNCVRTLPRLEYLGLEDCNMLTSIEHLPHTLCVLMYSHSNSTNCCNF